MTKKEKNIMDFSNPDFTIERPHLDLLLSNKDCYELKRFLTPLTLSISKNILKEKERLNILAKKPDLKFLKELFSFLDNKYQEEKAKYPNHFEMVMSQDSNPIEKNSKTGARNFNNISFNTKWFAYQNKKENSFLKSSLESLQEFKNEALCEVLKNKTNLTKEFTLDFLTLCSKLQNNKALNMLARTCAEKNNISLLEEIFESKTFKSHISKKHFLRNATYAAQNIQMLDYLWSKEPQAMKEGFTSMVEAAEFWWDFSPKIDNQHSYWTFRGVNKAPVWNCANIYGNIDKMIWLENHDMGYSHANFPYFIKFIIEKDQESFETYIDSIKTKEQTLQYINQSLKDYSEKALQLNEEESGDSPKALYEKQLSQYSSDVMLGDYTTSRIQAYNKIRGFLLKYNLEAMPENKDTTKTRMKI